MKEKGIRAEIRAMLGKPPLPAPKIIIRDSVPGFIPRVSFTRSPPAQTRDNIYTGQAYDCLHLYPNNKWYDEALSGQTRDVALYLETISEEDTDMQNIEFRFEEAP